MNAVAMTAADAYLTRPTQATLARECRLVGTGLHSGATITLTLRPAGPDTGIRFRRADIDQDITVPARWDRVVDGRRATSIGDGGSVTISTTEHLMAALAAFAVDNLDVTIDGPELPAMDGGAADYVDAIAEAGVAESEVARTAIRIRKDVTVEVDGARARLSPYDGLAIAFVIDYPNPHIGRQAFEADAARIDFRTEICAARTFCLVEEIDALRAAGLAKGGSLDNALVVGPDGLLNDGGLRFPDEFVRHKILDALGDLYLAGAPVFGRLEAERSGHATTHALLAALFSDPAAWARTPVG